MLDVESTTLSCCWEVGAERQRQNEKWGQQNHAPSVWLMILGEEVGEANKAALESITCSQQWEVDYWRRQYREELIQIAAVAVAMVESLDRNELATTCEGKECASESKKDR